MPVDAATRLALVACTLAFATAVSAVRAQEPDDTDLAELIIQIRHADEVNLNPTVSEPSLHPSFILHGAITVEVDGVACATADLPPVENRADLRGKVVATVTVGGPQQPAECSKEGAEVTFINGDGFLLYETTVFSPGLFDLTNFAVAAIQPGRPGDGGVHSGGPAALPGAGSAGLGDGGSASAWTILGLAMAAAIALAATVVAARYRSRA